MSESSHFVTVNNEFVVKKSGIYEIYFFDSYKAQKDNAAIWFRSTIISNGAQRNRKIRKLNTTRVGSNTMWLTVNVFLVTQLTAKHTTKYYCNQQW